MVSDSSRLWKKIEWNFYFVVVRPEKIRKIDIFRCRCSWTMCVDVRKGSGHRCVHYNRAKRRIPLPLDDMAGVCVCLWCVVCGWKIMRTRFLIQIIFSAWPQRSAIRSICANIVIFYRCSMCDAFYRFSQMAKRKISGGGAHINIREWFSIK